MLRGRGESVCSPNRGADESDATQITVLSLNIYGFLVATLLGMTGCGGSPDTIPTPVSHIPAQLVRSTAQACCTLYLRVC